jgi:hypothetical protein
VRLATFLVVLAACNDLHDFEGNWSGTRVGDDPVLKVGVPEDATAMLAIDGIDAHGFRGHLTITGLVTDASITSLPGAEADALSTMTFAGKPMRVYLAFVPALSGELLALIALYDSRRIEVRVLRGGVEPVYAIFTLSES